MPTVLKVALPLPLEAMSYRPPHGDGREALGQRVVVPWRGELRVGIVTAVEADSQRAFTLREAVAYLDEQPWLRPEELGFLHAAAQDCFCPLGTLLDDLLPFLEPPLTHRVRLVPGAPPSILPAGMGDLLEWQEARGYDPRLLDMLREAGVLEEEVRADRPSRKFLIPLREPDAGLSAKAQAALRTLLELGEAPSMAELARQAGVGPGVVKTLLEKGYAGWQERRLEPPLPGGSPLEPLVLPEVPARLNGGRLRDRLRLLAGIASQGPTLVLFPEVALLERWLEHFPQARPFHGELSAELRRQEFAGFRTGGVVFATYQGLLLPFTPRRIVVVEEASEAYKLPAGSRAHCVRLAERRAELLRVPLTYLSQVPSVETLEQPGLSFPPPRPRVHLLNLNQERGYPLSGAAVALLRQVEEKRRQAVVLAHRRGYSAVLRCHRCDWKAMCSNCAVPLRYHKGARAALRSPHTRAGVLICHQCGLEQTAPQLCPQCQSETFDFQGPGVEWVQDELRKHLPNLPLFRYSAELKDDLSPLLGGQPGVLVGTTAVLRAPVLPELALVLLPYADGFVLESDFRAAERYHRLLWQLTELHPRRRPLIALQTFEPAHPAHEALQAGDPEAFPRSELALRRALGYPPVKRMLKLEVSHPKEPVARDAANQLALALAPRLEPGEMLGAGPVPAPIPRVRNQFIFHLLLRSTSERLRELIRDLPRFRGVRVRLDPDPQSFVGLLED
ncbi:MULTISPECIES: primosomal protein N' [unclassified Meiothermus]|uniref:primosomal protein N' family DNA-binding protein n=1 Tax=unclassified Meiothermus TaxID=370471 RepID=UPI000D7C7B67|nr:MULTISPECIES: primosomal protein N' [unclassified Meiothermus]PZA08160.1 primosomal protein N' [Meiothermus sp. Pnk-1]RYM32289.1 primosomal protein N' [Meiothermus sp. PNK-Is4]